MNWWMMSADESCVVNMRRANALRICEHPYEHTWALLVDVLDSCCTLGEYRTFREAHEEMMRIVREMNSKEREEA